MDSSKMLYLLCVLIILCFLNIGSPFNKQTCVGSYDLENIESQISMYSEGLLKVSLQDVVMDLGRGGCLKGMSAKICYSYTAEKGAKNCATFSDLEVVSGYLSKDSLMLVSASMRASSRTEASTGNIQYLKKGDL